MSAFVLAAVIIDVKEGDWLAATGLVVLMLLLVLIYKVVKSRDELIDELNGEKSRRFRAEDEMMRLGVKMFAQNVMPAQSFKVVRGCVGKELSMREPGSPVSLDCKCDKKVNTPDDCDPRKHFPYVCSEVDHKAKTPPGPFSLHKVPVRPKSKTK